MGDTEVQTRRTVIEVRNPANGKVVGEVTNQTPDAVAATARELRFFQPEWEALGPKGRRVGLRLSATPRRCIHSRLGGKKCR